MGLHLSLFWGGMVRVDGIDIHLEFADTNFNDGIAHRDGIDIHLEFADANFNDGIAHRDGIDIHVEFADANSNVMTSGRGMPRPDACDSRDFGAFLDQLNPNPP